MVRRVGVTWGGIPGVGGVGGDPLETHPPEALPGLALDVAAVPSGEWPKKEGREGGCPGRKPQSFKAESQKRGPSPA